MATTKNSLRKKSEIEQLLSDVHSHNINHYTRELFLHSSLSPLSDDSEPGVDYRMAVRFNKNLSVLENQNSENVLVHMHSTGGNWCDGLAMFDAIRFANSSVTFITYAQASSMSGILLQAADKRVLTPNCEFMIHHGSIALHDNSIAVNSAVEMNNKYMKRMLQIFARRCKIGEFFLEKEYTESRIISWIDKKLKDKSDWYMSAEEAVYYGFADGILGTKGFETIAKIRRGSKFKECI
jgi:ATP-dependent protease ClpP protease subunit